MIDREAILPLGLGLVLALALHAAAVGGYVHYNKDQPVGPQPGPALADLAALIEVQSVVQASQPVEMKLRVVNRGTVPAASAALSLTLGDQVVELPATQALRVGQADQRLKVHQFDRPGVVLLKLKADALDQIAELDESNNEYAITVLVQAPPTAGTAGLPDLVVYDLKLPDRPLAGRPTLVGVQVANLGHVDVDRVPLAVVVDDQLLQSGVVDLHLAPGEMATVPLSVVVDEPGEHQLCVVADIEDAIAEVDEQNNAHCVSAEWFAFDPTRQPGQEKPADTLNMNLISHEAFEQIVAEYEERFDQPLVQMTAEPIPTRTNPLDPTDPANTQPSVAGGVPTPQSQVSPPAATHNGSGEQSQQDSPPSAMVAVDEPSDQPPQVAPVISDTPGEQAVAPAQADQPAPPVAAVTTPEPSDQPVTLVDATVSTNQGQAPPIAGDPSDEIVLTNPPIRIDRENERASIPLAVPDAPDSADVVRLTPEVQPETQSDPSDKSLAIDGSPGDEPRQATLTTPASADVEPTSPQDPPIELAMADPKTVQPDAEVNPADPAQANAAAGQQTQATTQPQPAAQEGQAALPTPVERSDLESPPVSRIRVAQIVPGATATVQGVQIKTVRPRFSPVAQGTAVPNNPVYTIRFDGQGKVIDIQEVRTTGWITYDAPLLTAVYKWRAEGNIAPEGLVIERLLIKLRPD